MADVKISGDSEKVKYSIFERGQLIAVLGAVGTFVLYVVARAYHDGYLNELNLSSSMFPLETSDVTIYAVVAIFRLLNFIISFLTKISVSQALYAFAVFGGVVALWGALNWIVDYFERKKLRVPPIVVKALRMSLHPWAIHWTKPAFGIFLVVYCILAATFVGVSFIIFLIYPYHSIGQMAAREELAKKFEGSPIAKLKGSDGAERLYKLVQCSDKFCAFFADDQVVAVAIADVKWVSSSVKLEDKK